MSITPTESLFQLVGKVALVTGAARGIGEGIARRLADAGARIVATDINADGINALARELGEGVLPIAADLTQSEDRARLVRDARAHFGGIDILINNAGLRDWYTWETLDEAHWDKFMDVNLRAPFFLSQAVAKDMIDRNVPGSIVNIVSTAAAQPVRWKVDYNAAKAGLAQMTRSLAKELGPHMIRVNAVGPGGTRTPGGSGSIPDSFAPDELRKMGADWRERMALPIDLMEPDDIARAVRFMASDAARSITGQILYVDGGFLVG
ncbi:MULTISPECIES: SDR family NAD(P)-dependent oxidoreductase [unclassified Sphingobium]|uniref:SDR family NAD(P)-dependent oxidoreductase n=1 Tax=unclassified Sphingobium TaxID=2611147 RepID=UPI00119A9182|nr:MULTISPECIES: SDR family oxidoreductase [unclassified Sphingobium]MBG6120059.1 NAD(P)-dependent dehydrogenase (short-subunit alcohol dehydrogenase family) [Sphingobium sp. JAI105]TWD05740.1 3-oxoacyl-[acyl-carrier protein] reductase/2-deoxy-D-gluconate 3-dehydrogenase [Sphingobium sp. AEW010]TWD23293.1 3-oxoacyl-[acyl-carrier protein] reductase/2-deoxy-D-gluconate 3-dehydrogenase [Sphingobium sp. AEW013]TWD25153.1 3-oxoacyl-[acyl-carrier protein] reductase/2-deoxy-D-gluconate 3-dehydrogenase